MKERQKTREIEKKENQTDRWVGASVYFFFILGVLSRTPEIR